MSQLAERYATALYEVTQKSQTTEDVLNTLLALKDSLSENPQVLQALKAPLMLDADKLAMMEAALKENLDQALKTFIKVLARNQRLDELPRIALAFENKVSQEKGVLKGTVKSAAELSSEDKDRIHNMIEKNLRAKVDLDFKVDSEMIGGIEAQVGSYIFEDSVKSHMTKLNDYITRRV